MIDFAKTKWRVIFTDSESDNGVAPECPHQHDSDGEHKWRAPFNDMDEEFDDSGVYDCCPGPQFELGSPGDAEAMVNLLNAFPEMMAVIEAARKVVIEYRSEDVGFKPRTVAALTPLLAAVDYFDWSRHA